MPPANATPPAKDSPHVLYVAWGYPPARSAGMYRALATANSFARDGWRVTVLTATRETFERITGTDPAAEGHIDPRINVVRIPFDEARGASDLQRWSRWRVFSPLAWNFAHALASQVAFPETGYGNWRPALVAAAEDIHRHTPVDLVVGSANPNVDFAPGKHLNDHYGIPYVMDYRDAWHLDVYTGKRLRWALSRSRRLERSLLAGAAEAWFVNSAIRDWHAHQYPRRAGHFHVVANGFDPAFVGSDERSDRADRPLTLGYLGTIYGPIPLREALEGWRIARQRSAIAAQARMVFRGRLGHFAEPDPRAAALLQEFAGDGVTYEGPVSKTQVAEVYQGFDAVLLIISRSKYVTSGKVFEYAATGLPIAALHHPETAATGVLEGYPQVFAVPEPTPRHIADALIATAEAAASLTAEDLARNRAWARSLSRDAQLEPRVAALRSLVTARSKDAS